MKVKFELQYDRSIFTVVTVVLRYLHSLKHSVAIFRDTVTRLGSKWPQSNSASFIPFGFLCQINRLGFIAVTVDTVVLKKPNFQNIFIFYYDRWNWKFQLKTDLVHHLEKSNGKLQGYCRIDIMHLAEILLQESVEGIEEARIKNILGGGPTTSFIKVHLHEIFFLLNTA